MSVRKLFVGASLSALAFAAAPAPASADWLFTPFVGANFAGDASFNDSAASFDDEVEKRLDFGASLGWMGNGAIGFEIDFGYSPNFFENTIGSGNFEFGDSNVTTLMGNVLVGIPIGGQTGAGVRPYASGGVGLIRNHISGGDFFDDLNANTFGFDVGAGVQGFFTDTIGVRGDVRYFRSLEDSDPSGDTDIGISNFDFWRATAGVTFRFGQ